jgi:hypothetical protein
MAYPGPNPPVGFRAALGSQLDSGSRFTFLLYQDQTGPFIGLDGDAAVRSAFARVLGWRFWKCPTPPEPGVRLPRSPPVAAGPPPQSPMPAAPKPGGLDADSLKQYGGVYSPACADNGAPRVRILADAILLEQGARQLTGSNLDTSFQPYGQEAPDDYQTAITGDLPGSGALTLEVFRGKHGQYLNVENNDPRIGVVLGKKQPPKKFWSCEPGRKVVAAEPPPAPVVAPASLGDGMPWTLIGDKRFRAAYRKALGPLAKTAEWLMKLEGPADKNRIIRIEGIDYVFAESCKIHECGDNTVVFLYAADRNAVYGKLVQASGPRLFGAPPPAIAAELDRLWRSVFAQNP